jgi:hypothetical protein
VRGDKIKGTYKRGFDVLNTVLSVIANAFAVINILFTMYFVVFNTTIKGNIENENIPNGINGFLYHNFELSIALIAVIFLLVIAIAIYLGLRRGEEALTARDNLLSLLHNDFIHTLRNHISRLDLVEEQIMNNPQSDTTNILKSEYSKLQASIKPYLDSLSDYYLETTGIKVAVCIKASMFDSDSEPTENKKLVDLERCKNTSRKRIKPNNSSVVGQNTDFEILYNEAGAFFGETDLKKKLKSGEYKTDSDSVEKGYYNSALVAPIRHLSLNIEQNSTSHSINIKPRILGFLCIDSKEKVDVWKDDDSYALELMGIYADALYIYLNKFHKCFEAV